MSSENVVYNEIGKTSLGVEGERAPILRGDSVVYNDSLILGKTTVSGAALMVEIVSQGKIVGHICSSLIGRKEIYSYHISTRQL